MYYLRENSQFDREANGIIVGSTLIHFTDDEQIHAASFPNFNVGSWWASCVVVYVSRGSSGICY